MYIINWYVKFIDIINRWHCACPWMCYHQPHQENDKLFQPFFRLYRNNDQRLFFITSNLNSFTILSLRKNVLFHVQYYK